LSNSAAISDTNSASEAGAVALNRHQKADGSWEGEVVWCPVITAQAVILGAITGRISTGERRRLIVKQFAITHRPDGGWGLHPESASYCFITTLVYVAARLLGEPPDHPMLVEARGFLARQPNGMFGLPQWGKVWLSFIGLYDKRGLNPCPPELFLLPKLLPFSPLRFYCHTRYIYLGIAYLVGSRFSADLGSITTALRAELYGSIDPSLAVHHRHDLARTDVYVYPGRLLRLIYDLVYGFGRVISYLPGAAWVRRRALDSCHERILFEQRQSNYQALSPVNGILNSLALFSRDPDGHDTVKSLNGVETWRWEDEAEGTRYAGARSTTWDTSFAMQALLAGGKGVSLRHSDVLRSAYRRLADMQMTSEIETGDHARDQIVGGWCFSDGVHRWPVSDCAAEAIIALVDSHDVPGLIPEHGRLSQTRMRQACDFILSRQNRDGGFGTYERRRGHRFLENLNPSEMFGQCMTELSYLECTASSVRALMRLVRSGACSDEHLANEAIRRGVALILARQNQDGSWPGFWGINFIYGTYFALAALREADLPSDHEAFTRASRWLRAVQHLDGGWGEHFSGCLTGSYADNSASLIIGTAWGCLAMMHAETEISPALQKGIDFLTTRQASDGSWPREGVNGVFFGTAMLEYKLYNSYFPIMALNSFENRIDGTH
jgi:squalene/oxidosqualene cyclase-like protein